ncbi:MAG TPA: hypothetical protein VGF96_05880 [Terracidiphilus sp.]|jgi:hypothetical protein
MANGGVGFKVGIKLDMDKIDLRLKELGPAIVRGSFMHGFNKVGKFWRELIQSKLPVGTEGDYDGGDLRDSIISRAGVNKNPVTAKGKVAGRVTVRPNARKQRSDGKAKSWTPAEYAPAVEFGLKSRDYPSQPVWRPVFDSTSEQAQQMFAQTVEDHLDEAVAKVRSQIK